MCAERDSLRHEHQAAVQNLRASICDLVILVDNSASGPEPKIRDLPSGSINGRPTSFLSPHRQHHIRWAGNLIHSNQDSLVSSGYARRNPDIDLELANIHYAGK